MGVAQKSLATLFSKFLCKIRKKAFAAILPSFSNFLADILDLSSAITSTSPVVGLVS